MAKIGFIGLGNMGGPMVANLLKDGHTVRCFDIVPELVQRAAAGGAGVAANAADVAEAADVLISMLPASVHVEALYLGEGGILPVIDPSTLVIDCSTIAPSSARKVAAAAAEAGLTMLDAPVSGGVGGAVAGTLTFMVGGSAEGLERGRAYFEVMGRNIFHAGEAGAGQVAKVCNNMLLAVQMTGTAEALALGVKNGLDPAVLSEIMRKSSGGNWPLEVYNPWPGVMPDVPASKNYEGGFLTRLMVKDLGLAMEAALLAEAATPMGALARNLYVGHSKSGYADKDFSSIQKLFDD